MPSGVVQPIQNVMERGMLELVFRYIVMKNAIITLLRNTIIPIFLKTPIYLVILSAMRLPALKAMHDMQPL